MELASGDKAIPASPIAPEWASGTIRKKGTVVIIALLQAPPKGFTGLPEPSSKQLENCALKATKGNRRTSVT